MMDLHELEDVKQQWRKVSCLIRQKMIQADAEKDFDKCAILMKEYIYLQRNLAKNIAPNFDEIMTRIEGPEAFLDSIKSNQQKER